MYPRNLETFKRPFAPLPQPPTPQDARTNAQIYASRDWRHGKFTPGDRYYRPDATIPAPSPIFGPEGRSPKLPRGNALGNLGYSADKNERWENSLDDLLDDASDAAYYASADASAFTAEVPAINYQGINAYTAPAGTSYEGGATVTRPAPTSPGILDSIFASFGGTIGKTAAGVLSAQGAGLVKNAQLANGIPQPVQYTTPMGTFSNSAIIVGLAALAGLYLVTRKD